MNSATLKRYLQSLKHLCDPEGAEEADLEQACRASKCAYTAQDDAESVTLDLEVFWPLARLCSNNNECQQSLRSTAAHTVLSSPVVP